ncbi:hypothetical protein GWK47_039580 [Chionoecetes opilio]|uniref:Uncharacterized protein n=1 Tax=Chionoecetes opilio TaxID=41210 RepID=A0A8J4YBG4_CHIOP|nr:hypothetical protein GWK47_039580 [Chionoecetes opilio]
MLREVPRRLHRATLLLRWGTPCGTGQANTAPEARVRHLCSGFWTRGPADLFGHSGVFDPMAAPPIRELSPSRLPPQKRAGEARAMAIGSAKSTMVPSRPWSSPHLAALAPRLGASTQRLADLDAVKKHQQGAPSRTWMRLSPLRLPAPVFPPVSQGVRRYSTPFNTEFR